MRKVDIEIPRKKGPFYIRKLRLHETLEIMTSAQKWGNETTHLKLVQACLCRQDGKPVYQANQMEKMEDDLGGVLIIKLGMDAQEENNFSELGQFADKVETAEKKLTKQPEILALYRLAYALKRPVAELDITLDEFAHWIAFESIHPFEDMRNEFMVAQLISVVVSALGKARPKPTEFMLSNLINKSRAKPKDEVEYIKDIFGAMRKDGA